ncbi:MAG: magnesium transporter CorA family protein [Planctomycetes bacterium]|nr:magnesium transporter CorA family protein [Planctomycetota bacterium]
MTMSCIIWDKVAGLSTDADMATSLAAAADPKTFAWIDLAAPAASEIDAVARTLQVHELTVEALSTLEERPRVDVYDDHLFVVFRALRKGDGGDVMDPLNAYFLLFKSTLVTLHHQPIGPVEEVKATMSRRPDLMKLGPAYLMYAVLDRIVDGYLELIDAIEDDIESLDEGILDRLDPRVPGKVFQTKKTLTKLRRRTIPHRELLDTLGNQPSPFIPEKARVYYRSLYDHLTRVDDRVNACREFLQGALDAYMALEARQGSEVMRVLSLGATVMLPLGILTGLYGTNFKMLPGADHPLGFWVFLGIMLTLAGTGAIYFRWRKWL